VTEALCRICNQPLTQGPFSLARRPDDQWYRAFHRSCWKKFVREQWTDGDAEQEHKAAVLHPGELTWSSIAMQGGIIPLLLGFSFLLFTDSAQPLSYLVTLFTAGFWSIYIGVLILTRLAYKTSYE
jgi:hypothetical protein